MKRPCPWGHGHGGRIDLDPSSQSQGSEHDDECNGANGSAFLGEHHEHSAHQLPAGIAAYQCEADGHDDPDGDNPDGSDAELTATPHGDGGVSGEMSVDAARDDPVPHDRAAEPPRVVREGVQQMCADAAAGPPEAPSDSNDSLDSWGIMETMPSSSDSDSGGPRPQANPHRYGAQPRPGGTAGGGAANGCACCVLVAHCLTCHREIRVRALPSTPASPRPPFLPPTPKRCPSDFK